MEPGQSGQASVENYRIILYQGKSFGIVWACPAKALNHEREREREREKEREREQVW